MISRAEQVRLKRAQAAAGIEDAKTVVRRARDLQRHQAVVATDAVLDMDNEVAFAERRGFLEEILALRRFGLRHFAFLEPHMRTVNFPATVHCREAEFHVAFDARLDGRRGQRSALRDVLHADGRRRRRQLAEEDVVAVCNLG